MLEADTKSEHGAREVCRVANRTSATAQTSPALEAARGICACAAFPHCGMSINCRAH